MVQHPEYPPTLGARLRGDGRCKFLVWAPNVERLELKLLGPQERLLPMQPRDRGYYELTVDNVAPGTQYFYRIDGDRDRPDPASRFQPDGVHAASAIVDSDFAWTDRHWHGIALHQYVTYELHVGTFTPEGTFDAIIPHLAELKELGITAIELMPVAQFPGGRNWGYDGVHPFAVQNTYGGPAGLKRLVNAAHEIELAVVMDVVYNHIGPEGNYLGEFGHYFTSRHHTPWGEAINFDDHDSDEVRRYFIENALSWLDEYHIDALRLDAVHAIYDFSARPFLQELADAVRLEGERLNRRVYTIAESSLSDARLISPKELGGCGIDGQWCDDLHHAIRTSLTDEQSGYFADYHGFDDIVKAFRDGFVQDGGYSEYRGRKHGNSARHVDPVKLVVCAQNHDQVGNRLFGERLTELVSFEQLKLAAALVILSPCQPMLFMGEEYAETARFQFFISHTDPGLVEAVRKGRREEFVRFEWQQEPPDPQAEETFERCKLNHALKKDGHHRVLRDCYRRLLELRRIEPSLAFPDRTRTEVEVFVSGKVMGVRRWSADGETMTLYHFGSEPLVATVGLPGGAWDKIFDTAEPQWNGPGSSLSERVESSGEVRLSLVPYQVAVYKK
jgi:maltooligosyltrehalose trehalohydrolase